ncbi:uroporphyrinogen-III synthase [Demequina globuliformis]|uniref:uroporphyrinogen-III synthase n=1 Tax=Demequina globuliformis TaxID=676202 RepID=UPI0007805A98|nr:uroporphyrinogen-III synthase [Demequina globuliformis]
MDLSVLEGKRLLVPVTAQRRLLAQRLADAGAVVEEVEFIAIAGPASPEALEAATLAWCAGDYDWMAVTSRNAVTAMDRIARARGMRLSNPQPQAKVATVGEATRAVCEQVGLAVDLVPTDKLNARGIVAEFPEGGGRILAPLGNLASPVLERGLGRKGWTVDVVEAYRTVDGDGPDPDVREMLADGAFDAVLLTSGSVAERLATTCPEMSADTTIIAIGDMTAASARAVGMTVAAVAQAPSYDGIVAGLLEALDPAAAERADADAASEPSAPSDPNADSASSAPSAPSVPNADSASSTVSPATGPTPASAASAVTPSSATSQASAPSADTPAEVEGSR